MKDKILDQSDPLYIYCSMWRDLEFFLHVTIEEDNFDEYPQAREFLSLMEKIKRKHMEDNT